MDKLDNIGENEIRIIGSNNEEPSRMPRKHSWPLAWIVAGALVIGALIWLLLSGGEEQNATLTVTAIQQDVTSKQKTPSVISSYVVISDTIINNVSLHRYIPVKAKPKLVMGLLKQIPSEYVLGAMAADFGKYGEEYQVVGGFVYHGEIVSHSKSKYGFCALLKDTVVIGNDLTTSYFEQAVEEMGDFFRQHALVHQGEVVNSVISQSEALRRALCRLDDGRICIIDTDMSVSLAAFSTALCQYGVVDAIALMGSGAAVRWAVDQAGRRYIAGADEYDFPEVVNYIVWEKE